MLTHEVVLPATVDALVAGQLKPHRFPNPRSGFCAGVGRWRNSRDRQPFRRAAEGHLWNRSLPAQRLNKLTPIYLPSPSRIALNPRDARLAPDHRPVTVMFVNYVGISDLIEDLGESHPQIIVEQLNAYFVSVAQVGE